jgi:hypothetical protein
LDQNLTLLRPQDEDRPLIDLDDECDKILVSETDVQAFPEGAPEHCVLSVVRTPAILLTPTCNLREDWWIFSPLHSLAANPHVNRNTLHSTTGGYQDTFGVYAHPKGDFEESFVTFHDLISVPAEPFRFHRTSRVINLSKESQNFFEEKLARFLSRGWGYAPDEEVETEGFYRCRACIRYYGLEDATVFLKRGEHPPKCKYCKRGQWELLLKHKKSRTMTPEQQQNLGLFRRVKNLFRR